MGGWPSLCKANAAEWTKQTHLSDFLLVGGLTSDRIAKPFRKFGLVALCTPTSTWENIIIYTIRRPCVQEKEFVTPPPGFVFL